MRPSHGQSAACFAAGALLGAAVAVRLVRRDEAARLARRRSGQYHAGMIQLEPALLEQYIQLHDHTWDEVRCEPRRARAHARAHACKHPPSASPTQHDARARTRKHTCRRHQRDDTAFARLPRQVMARMYASNMRDFTVWLHEGSHTLFHQVRRRTCQDRLATNMAHGGPRRDRSTTE